MRYLKSSGYIDVDFSGCCCPPDAVKPEESIHTRGFTFWWRIGTDKSDYTGPWTQFNGEIFNDMMEIARTVDSPEAFKQRISE